MELNPGLYRTLIDPWLKSLRQRVVRLVDEGSDVLDIACGTGDLAFMLAAKCHRVTGIDLYEPMVRYASREAVKSRGLTNTGFHVADASDLSEFADDSFDVATMSLALHQFDPAERTKIIHEALRVAPVLIVADYAHPIETGFFRAGIHVAERIAGRGHYRNFRSFGQEGGTDVIAEKQNFRLIHSELSGSGVFAVMTIGRKTATSSRK